jgi:uncharacterized iron-regulated protein
VTWTRRAWTRQASAACGAWAATALLGACANRPGEVGDRIVDTSSGHGIGPADVLRRMQDADIVLLGEVHDNPHHHARRADLLAGLQTAVAVVAEHLPRDAAPSLPADASGDRLRVALEASGFDAKGWRWPMHEPLFAAVARAGHVLHGGNLDRDAARRLAREGPAAFPASLASLIEAGPLSTAAMAALEQDLQLGHCGHLGRERVPGMVAAQRGRDAALAEVLLTQLENKVATRRPRPVILLAGNGHVRQDYGVPSLLTARLPRLRVLSIGFLEPAEVATAKPSLHDITWTTSAATRDDPCKAFPAARPASA